MIPQRHSKEHLKAEGREMEKQERCDVSCFFFFKTFFSLHFPEVERIGRDF